MAVDLLDTELVLLDGLSVRAEVQKAVEDAKARLRAVAELPSLPESLAALVADAVRYAQENGRLGYRSESTHYCQRCGKSGGYAKYKRGGRTKYGGWHSKGDEDRSKPLTIVGVDLSISFIIIRGHIALGCCWECWEKIRPALATALDGVKAEVHEHITGHPPRFKWHPNVKCSACGWTGHEGQMGRLPTLFRDGTYPGECPKCHAKNEPFGPRVIKTAEGWQVVPNSEDAS